MLSIRKSKLLSFSKELTLYYLIQTFNNPKNVSFRKHCGKRRKCWLPAFSPFPTMFCSLLKTNFIFFLVTFILLSANAFNLDCSDLSFAKELRDMKPGFLSCCFFSLENLKKKLTCFPPSSFTRFKM